MIIVAIDLAISKSVACIYNQENGEHKFVTFPTKPQEIHDLMLEYGLLRKMLISVSWLVCCWAMLRDGSRWRVPAASAGGK